MKIYLILFSLCLQLNDVQADAIRVLNFNTMCDFCKGSSFFDYSKRQKELRELIQRHKPDLMSLQELRTRSQVEELVLDTEKYGIIATEGLLMSYADPAIVYNKNKFRLITFKNYWLGPNHGRFSFGWRSALPRQILIAEFVFQGAHFHFVSTHFDNLKTNLKGSIEALNQIASELKGPILFAGDTNIPVDMKLYQKFSLQWHDAFELKESFQILGDYQSDLDICYLKKGKVFPTCRVEHFLVDKKYNWKVKNILLDAKRNSQKEFPSDHRAYVLDVIFPSDAPQSSLSNQ